MTESCFNCDHCLYICEGDYICDLDNSLIIEDFSDPTEDFFFCDGEGWDGEE